MPSPTRTLFLVSCGLAAGIAFRAAAAADPPPCTAAFADGTRANAPQIAGWHDAAALPSVDGRPLFDDANPARWVIGGPPPVAVPGDRAPLPPGEEPAAFVEFVGGDRLPGIVEEHRSGLENWSERLPPHLFVRPATVVDQPGKPLRAESASCRGMAGATTASPTDG